MPRFEKAEIYILFRPKFENSQNDGFLPTTYRKVAEMEEVNPLYTYLGT